MYVLPSISEAGSDSEGEGDWKGRVISLFSPVLKFVGGNQEHHQEQQPYDEQRKGGKEEEEEVEDHMGENDLNWENTSSNHNNNHHHAKVRSRQHRMFLFI